jgi:hypothetical protein
MIQLELLIKDQTGLNDEIREQLQIYIGVCRPHVKRQTRPRFALASTRNAK